VNGKGWVVDDFWLAAVAFADDILLVGSSLREVQSMLEDIIEAFALVGLEIGAEKTNWSSWPRAPLLTLRMQGEQVAWSPQFVFVGNVVDLSGGSGAAVEYRMAQANKVFYRWKKILQCPSVSLRRRAAFAAQLLTSSLVWLAETWYPTKAQTRTLDSWAKRKIARVANVRRAPDEDIGSYWRRMYRRGQRLLEQCGGAAKRMRRFRVHRFAGHFARMSGICCVALRTRCLAWWRYRQARHHSKHYGVHPARFKAWRWESQLTSIYGEAECENPFRNAGWTTLAQDRAGWRSSEAAFAGA